MIVLLGVLAHTGLWQLVDSSSGAAMAFTLALSSVAVGTLASQSVYTTWYQKSLWLLAFLMVFMAMPDHLEISRTLRSALPARLYDLWLVIVILALPTGILVGILRTWRGRWRRE